MALQVSNRINGTVGHQVSDAALAASAGLGTVTIEAAGPRAVYSDTQTVWGLSVARVDTAYHRGDTPHLQVDLPATPWHLRWYVRVPPMQTAGYGVNETRWLARLGDYGLVASESSDGKILLYLQPDGLASARHTYDVASGTWPLLDQIHRVEISYDGTDVAVSLYTEHDTTPAVTVTWQSFTLNATTAELTSYRFRRGVLLQPGMNDASLDGTPIEDRQNQILVWDPDALPMWGADGDYGAETTTAVQDFQTEYGLSPVDGEIGPETGAALDLVVQEIQEDPTPPPTYISHLAMGTTAIGPAPPPNGDGEGLGVTFDLEGTAEVGAPGTPMAVEFDLADVSPSLVQGEGEDLGVAFDLQGDGNQFGQGEGEGLGVVVDHTNPDSSVHSGTEGLAAAFDLADGGATLYFQGQGTLPVVFDLADTSAITGDGEGLGVTFDLEGTGQAQVDLPDVPLVGLRYRLLVYDPDGELRGQLPYPLALRLGVPHNDMPSLTLEYLKDAPGAALLSDPCEVAVELAPADSLDFVEYEGCRFLNLREKDDLTDRTGVVRYTMPEYAWMLRKVRNIESEEFNEDGERAFTSATVGEIIHTFLIEAQARDNIPGMVWDFTSTHDSAGQVWDQSYNLSFSAGQDLWSVLDSLAGQGAVDWRMHERTLQLYVVDTELNRDRTDAVVLRLHRDITEAPNDSSAEDLASRIFVQGDGATAVVDSSGALQPWGSWEDYISQSGVSDTGTLLTLAQWRLEKTRALRRQMTRGLLFSTTLYLPFIHYLPGDRVTAPGVFSPTDPLRVRQITLASLDGQGMEGNVILNDRFLERELRRDKQVNALTGGASGTPGGGGGRPGEDTRTPKAPTDLLLSTNTYLNELGEPRGQITAAWTAVEQATNNTDMDVDAYQVWVRHAVFGETFRYYTTVDAPDVTAFMSPFDVDEVYEVRVRAIGHNDKPGEWSATNSISVEPDATAPPTPSAPGLSTHLGAVSVAWDGLTWDGLGMPIDFGYVRVWMSDDPVTGFEQVNTLYREGSVVVAGLPYDVEHWFYLTALDRSGNESDPSAVGSISATRLVPSDDFGPGSIGYELLAEGAVRDDILADEAVMNRHVAAGQITGDKVRAYSITADRIAVGNTKNLLSDPNLRDADLTQVRRDLSTPGWTVAYSATTEQNWITLDRANVADGTYLFYYVQSVEAQSLVDPAAGLSLDEDLGRVIMRARVTIENLTTGSIDVTGWAQFLDSSGSQVGALQTVATRTFSGDASEEEIISVTGAVPTSSAVTAVLYFEAELVGTPADARLYIRKPFAALSNGTVLIENGAISADKVAANAITADKIDAGAVEAEHISADAVVTDSLAANAITSKHTITGATLQTTETANRGIKITNLGMWGYDGTGNQTFAYQSVDGTFEITGRLQTGVDTGNNVVVDSDLYNGRPAIQLNTGTSDEVQPVMYSLGAGSSGYPAGALVLHGREAVINSSGRNTFQVNAGDGSGIALGQEYGTYAGMGFAYELWDLTINGRMAGGSGRLVRQFFVKTGTFSGSGPIAQSFTYGAAAPNGGRQVQATAVADTTDFQRVIVGVTQSTLSSFRVVGDPVLSISYRINCLVTWISSSAE